MWTSKNEDPSNKNIFFLFDLEALLSGLEGLVFSVPHVPFLFMGPATQLTPHRMHLAAQKEEKLQTISVARIY